MTEKQNQPMTVEMLHRIYTNPFYCINISEALTDEHKPLITEDAWIAIAIKLITEIGAEKFLKNLLENLKGNYITQDGYSPDGYIQSNEE